MEFSVAIMLILLGILTLTGVTGRIQEASRGGPPRGEPGGPARPPARPRRLRPQPRPRPRARRRTGTPRRRRPRRGSTGSSGGSARTRSCARWSSGWSTGSPGRPRSRCWCWRRSRDPWWATGYLLVFGVGTIAGMMLITAAVAVPFAVTAGRFAWLNRHLATASGVLSLGVRPLDGLPDRRGRRAVRRHAPLVAGVTRPLTARAAPSGRRLRARDRPRLPEPARHRRGDEDHDEREGELDVVHLEQRCAPGLVSTRARPGGAPGASG